MDKMLVAAKICRAAFQIESAEAEYYHDPDHRHAPPGGGWHRTEKGWSRKNPSGPERPGKKIEQLEYKDRAAMAENPETDAAALDRLSMDFQPEIRLAVARNRNASPETLDRLAGHPRTDIREAVAVHENASPETLEKLSRDKESSVRRRVAKNRGLPPEKVKKLLDDEDFGVRLGALQNPNCPADVLTDVARNSDDASEVAAVGFNPGTPPQELIGILKRKGSDRRVMEAVAANRSTPEKVLKIIVVNLKDSHYYRHAVQQALSRLEQIKKEKAGRP